MADKKKKLRPLGDVTTDLEKIMWEMTLGHKLQVHEIFGIIAAWAEVHNPDAIEHYVDGTRPVLYGHKSNEYKPKEK